MNTMKTFLKNKHGKLLVVTTVAASSLLAAPAFADSDYDALSTAAITGLVGLTVAISALYTGFIGVGIVAKGMAFLARKVGFR